MADNPDFQWWVRPNLPEPDSWWGQSQTAQTLGAQVALMQQLGVQIFRTDIPWMWVAPNLPGGSTYSSRVARDPNWSGYNWSRFDLMVHITSQAGIQLEVIVDFTPTWARGGSAGTNAITPPASSQYYADFLTALVTRYKGQIHFWELWNEEDDTLHSWGGTMDQYVQLILKPGYEAVKAVDPTAQVLLGGLAGDTHLPSVYAAGGGPYFDIVNFHAYYPVAVADSTALDHIRSAARANGDTKKPIWLTEFGYPSQASTTPNQSSPTPTPGGVTAEDKQAQLIGGVYSGLKIGAIFYYELHDTDVYDAQGDLLKHVYWGLVSHDLTHHKKGFDVYKAIPEGVLPSFRASNGAAIQTTSNSSFGDPVVFPLARCRRLLCARF